MRASSSLSATVFASYRSRSSLVCCHLSHVTGDISSCYAEDELVSLDELQEKISEFDDYVQSTDVAAMQSKLIPVVDWIQRLTLPCRALNVRVMYPYFMLYHGCCIRKFIVRIAREV